MGKVNNFNSKKDLSENYLKLFISIKNNDTILIESYYNIAKKFGLGRFDTFIKEVLIANDEINFSIPDVNSNGQ